MDRVEQRRVCSRKLRQEKGVVPVALALVAGDGFELSWICDQRLVPERTQLPGDPRRLRPGLHGDLREATVAEEGTNTLRSHHELRALDDHALPVDAHLG